MALLFIFALWSAIPDRKAVALEKSATEALQAGEYHRAEVDFARVLGLNPKSTHARLGLACAYFLTGHRSRVMLELTMAFEIGLPPGPWECGHRVDLSHSFFSAKLGLYDAFAVPRVEGAGRYERMLTDQPTVTSADDSQRLLMGACLAFRSHLDGAGWYYAANAAERTPIDGTLEDLFFGCAGRAVLRHLRCHAGLRLHECVLTDRVRAAYLRDRPYLRPAAQPAAFADLS